jgi:coenzyme F420-0:L-glutamate ligase/coenzyme F420-1:gamma-L-glutamate ligase
MNEIRVIGVKMDKEVYPGDDIAKLFIDAIKDNNIELLDNDIIVIAHKIVSKAEGRIINLLDVEPSEEARTLADVVDKDPRIVELILRESKKILKVESGHIISLTHHNIVCANAGIDKSNAGGENRVVLLPKNPDESALAIRKKIMEMTGRNVAVIISDTYGRPFRWGVINLAVGFSGINPYRDYIGRMDRDGYIMTVTRVAVVDELASAAELVIGQGAENTPFAIVRGIEYIVDEEAGYSDIYMPMENWLFR